MLKPLILVDGSSYFFRAFHALPPLTNSKGQPTGAIYGVVSMIRRLIKDHQCEQLAIVFDAQGKTFRDEWYPEYKAHRSATPPDLHKQFPPLIEVLTAMGLPLLIVEGVEADDVIGTLARLATEQGQPVIISTSDKDMLQLVNEHVTIINTMTNQVMDSQAVKEKYGITPAQFIDYLTLVGDSVDNIPGVTKCGPKTALKWLEQYENLDNLCANVDKISGKIGDYLRASLKYLPLSKRLVTIKTDVELPLTLTDLKTRQEDKEKLVALVQELEFKSWLKELLDQQNQSSPTDHSHSQGELIVITTQAQLDSFLQAINDSSHLCLKTETTDPTSIHAEIVGLSLAVDENLSAYLPFLHRDETQLERASTLNALKPILENEKINKIGYNLKYDYNLLKNHGIYLKGIVCDTMLASYILDSTAQHDLAALALKYLGRSVISYEEVVGKGAKQQPLSHITLARAAPYAISQVSAILALYHKFNSLLQGSLKVIYQEIEMPLLQVLAEMERQGVFIDIPTLEKHGQRLKARLSMLEQEATELAGQSFNLNSPKQLQEILFDKLQLPILAKTPTGQPSTAEAVLQELAYQYQLPAVILEYRSLSKLVSTYIDALPKRVQHETRRVHTCYNQAITVTGRLSSSEPNLQNIPIRSEEGRLIRTAFIAPPDHVLLAADYSQIELRIMAHLSADPNLLKAFASGWDIHTATASEIFQVSLNEVSHEQRRRAKAVNFGLIYGMSAFGLAKQLGIDRQDAQLYMDCYFQRYPGVLDYMERTRKQAHEQGYVETLFGRRLYLPDINARNLGRQRAAERMAINAPMQGTAADIIKKAMIAVFKWQESLSKPVVRMIMQVHDELVFEIKQEAIDWATKEIHQLMENAVELVVPLQVSIGVGKNWDEAH
ncbi:DNA polymerase I [Legionella beliardensis]|uniref:DNA polymerase I n=1 Tax=Legionella beliardensis TaxID=91822 RepID=A0A378HY52_9GAMM|nr:DNA polymerase I [Legionella beliardensis]STX27633.1 DNA polymerase I [Legionella beliardensis]